MVYFLQFDASTCLPLFDFNSSFALDKFHIYAVHDYHSANPQILGYLVVDFDSSLRDYLLDFLLCPIYACYAYFITAFSEIYITANSEKYFTANFLSIFWCKFWNIFYWKFLFYIYFALLQILKCILLQILKYILLQILKYILLQILKYITANSEIYITANFLSIFWALKFRDS